MRLRTLSIVIAFVLVAGRGFCYPADEAFKIVEQKSPGNPKRIFGYVTGILGKMNKMDDVKS